MIKTYFNQAGEWLYDAILSVPVRIKITGIVLLPVVILGLSLNYWVTASLSDWLSYLLTDVRVEAAMQAGGRSVLLVTVLAAAGSFILSSLLTFILTRPLLAVREMAQEVASGNLEARAPVWSNDEIGDVASAINSMTDQLLATQESLAHSNRRLDAINRVMLAAEREEEIHDVLYAILENTVKVIGSQAGWVYLRDPERDLYHLASWYDAPTELEGTLLHQRTDPLCACQSAYTTGEWTHDARVVQCERLRHYDSDSRNSQHISVPIHAREQFFGVMNLLCEPGKTLLADELELLSAIGAQVSEIVANAWLRLMLSEKESDRKALLESLVEAQEEERGRLARELHDGSGQMLTSLLVRIKTLERTANSVEVREGLTSLLDIVSETIEQVRELSHRLRPAALEEFGLAIALETLLQDMAEEAGLATTFRSNLDGPKLPKGIDVTLYRIAQEALTNIIRHACASSVTAELRQVGDHIQMRIADDGIGFDPHQVNAVPEKRHLGIISMYERTAIVGGTLDLFSVPGKGTTVQVNMPVLESVTNAQ